MNYLGVLADYVVWWYSGGLKRLYLWLSALFGWLNNYFSIGRVIKTLFSPWKRLVGEKRPGLDGFRDFLVDNLISRSVGFVMRLIIIFVYLLSLTILLIFSLFCFVFWIGWPIWLVVAIIKVFV